MDRADVVVVSGGVIGEAVAYHLGKQGVRRVVLIERHLAAQGNSSGCLYAAVAPASVNELKDLALVSDQAGLENHWLDYVDAGRLAPWLKLPLESMALFMPDDGYMDGYSLAQGYLRAARHSHNDIPLLSLVDHPVAVSPSAALYALAKKNHWEIILM